MIFEGRQDLIVAAITTTKANAFPGLDVIISIKSRNFSKTGLKTTSVLKLTKISTIRKDLAEGELGDIEGDLRDEVNGNLK